MAAAVIGASGMGLVATSVGSDALAHTLLASTTRAQAATGPLSATDAQETPSAPAPSVTPSDRSDQLRQIAVTRAQRKGEQAELDARAAAGAQAALDAQLPADAQVSLDEQAATAAEAAAEAARPQVVNPVPGARLSSSFGDRWGTVHAGIDLAAPMLTPEHAVLDGVVLQAGPAQGFGLAVYLQHPDGDVTVYGHMNDVLVTAGQVVRAGDAIALMGNQGQSTGPHLHLEVHRGGLGGEQVDPVPWLAERGVHL